MPLQQAIAGFTEELDDIRARLAAMPDHPGVISTTDVARALARGGRG